MPFLNGHARWVALGAVIAITALLLLLAFLARARQQLCGCISSGQNDEEVMVEIVTARCCGVFPVFLFVRRPVVGVTALDGRLLVSLFTPCINTVR